MHGGFLAEHVLGHWLCSGLGRRMCGFLAREEAICSTRVAFTLRRVFGFSFHRNAFFDWFGVRLRCCACALTCFRSFLQS